jgi:hypothetical protein
MPNIIAIQVCTERSNKKKIRVGENGGFNQSKHQNSTIQVIDRTLLFKVIIT